MKKKILIDLLNLATPEIAGVGVFARNLFEPWFADEKLPYTFVVYSSHAVDVEKVFHFKSSSSILIKRIEIKHVLARFLYQQILLPFRLWGCDLYFNPTVGLPFLARIIAPKVKLVVTIHDMIPFFYKKKYSAMRGFLVKILSRQAARMAHHIITVSENSKNDIAKIARIGQDKITVVYNFIPPPYELANEADENFFLCISTLEPGKNVENAIRGFGAFLKKTDSSFKFYWVGRLGWVYSQEQLDKLVKDEGLEHAFKFSGYMEETDKKNLLRTCTAIVYLSHYEGFGLPVLEGMTFNKTAVVSNNSSLPEVVGKAGVLCDPTNVDSIADALSYIVANKEALTRAIPLQLGKFSPDQQVDRFKQMINELLRLTVCLKISEKP